MKQLRIVIVILAVLFCLAGTTAFADTSLEFDAAFSSGTIMLREAGMDLDLDVVEIIAPESFWETHEITPMLGGDFRTEMEYEEAELPVSISENGTMLFIGGAMALHDGRLTLFWPNPNKGVPDEYGNLEKYLSLPLEKRIRSEGVAWSPDGRYFVVLNGKPMMKTHGNLVIDPILMDTQTGDMILTATYPSDKDSGFREAKAGACFSPDGKYLYYTVNTLDSGSRLLRYDLETGETELCLNMDQNYMNSSLFVLRDGSLLTMFYQEQSENESSRWGIARFFERDGMWHFEKPWLQPSLMFGSPRLACSRTSGTVLMIEEGNYTAMHIFRPEQDFEGIDDYWYIAKDTMQPVRLSDDELSRHIPDHSNMMWINLCAFSPDGRYLMVGFGSKGDPAVWACIRLSDMTAVPIEFESGADQLSRKVLRNDTGAIVWTEEGILISANGVGEGFYVLNESQSSGSVISPPTDTAVESPDVTITSLSIDLTLGEEDGVHLVAPGTQVFRWQANPEAEAYSLDLSDLAGNELYRNDKVTETSARLDTRKLHMYETYRLSISPSIGAGEAAAQDILFKTVDEDYASDVNESYEESTANVSIDQRATSASDSENGTENEDAADVPAASETWICPSCGKESEGNYCPWCGTKRQSEVVCPSCGEVYDASKGYAFCAVCGTPLTDPVPSPDPTATFLPTPMPMFTSTPTPTPIPTLIPSPIPTPTPAPTSTPTPAPTSTPTPEPTPDRLTFGDTFTFGHFPQTSSGTDDTPIEWVVCAYRGDGATVLISRYALDARLYNDKNEIVSWQDSSLHEWLNGEFMDRAFTSEEQEHLLTDQLSDEGEYIGDRVFLASPAYLEGEDIKCAPTDYAKARGAFNSYTEKAHGLPSTPWWTPPYEDDPYKPGCVNYDGTFFNITGGTYAPDGEGLCFSVRPMIYYK